MQVEDVMKKASGKAGSIIVNQSESINNAATLMKENNIQSIPVVNDDSKVVGIITRRSIIDSAEDLNEDFFLD